MLPRYHCCTAVTALLILLTVAGCGPTSFMITPVPAERELSEYVVSRESAWAAQKVALVEADGLLQNARPSSLLGVGDENPVALFTAKLNAAANDSAVRAVVLRINSPGGTVGASEIMYNEVRRFREQSGKPVIAAMMDVAASGGYYVACATDKIYAQPSTITGSIGVIMLLPNFSGTMQKIGMEMNVIKSGPLKDTGSPFREMNEQDRAVLQGLNSGMYDRFLSVVAWSRKDIPAERLRTLADGRVYLGTQAKENGLVDELGTLRDAIACAKAAAGLDGKAIKVVEYARPPSYHPNIYAESPAPPAQVNLVNIVMPDLVASGTPQMLYLWAPGW
jgi:protease IV